MLIVHLQASRERRIRIAQTRANAQGGIFLTPLMNTVNNIDMINKLNVMPKLFTSILSLLLVGATMHADAQLADKKREPLAGLVGSRVLGDYIKQGLDSNLALHQRNFDLQQSELNLKRAQALFYPSAVFSSQYTLAHGGRSQSIPVGDLLNNVYSTLNQLTNSTKFPQVGNQSIQFLPNDYHDTKMEISMPLINPDLQHNQAVNREMIHTRQADLDIYRRDLVQKIKQAYYQYLQADKAVAIYTNALALARENRRVSEKFVENRMATKEIVLRAQAQVSQGESSLIEARSSLENGAAYFNCLLNRPLDAEIVKDETLEAGIGGISGAGDASSEVPTAREELSKLNSYRLIMESNQQYDKKWLVPRLNIFYDVGFQGFGFHFDNSQFYQLAGLQLQWTLFKGGDNKYKIHQAEIDVKAIGEQYRDVAQQLSLQVRTSSNDYHAAVAAMTPLEDEVTSAKETYRLAEKRFNEGQALQIELIDARTQMTSAELRYSLGWLTVLNRAADLERATASYRF